MFNFEMLAFEYSRFRYICICI